MHLDHCYAFILLPSGLKKFFEEGDPVTYFDPNLGYVRKTTFVRDHEYFIPTKLCKYPSSGSVVKADYVFPYIYMHLCNPPPPLNA